MHLSSLFVAVVLGMLGGLLFKFLRTYLERARPTRPATAAELAAVTNVPIPAGQAMLYVFRPPMPGDKAHDVELDGALLAKLKGGSYLRLAIQPGQHQLSSGPVGIAALAQATGTLAFTAAAGETVILSAHPGTGGFAQNTVRVTLETNQAESLNAIATMKRVDI